MSASAARRLTTPAKRMEVGEALIRRNPLFFPDAVARFARLSSAPIEERRRVAAALLSDALRLAGRTPYGRSLGTPDTLLGWPLLEPSRVRERPVDFVGDRWFAIPSSTGGTSGIPLPLWRSPRSVAVEQAALDHVLRTRGVDPRTARVAVLRGDDVKPPDEQGPPFWIETLGGRRRVFSSNHLNRTTVQHYLEALREFDADYWWVYPTTLESLVRLTLETGGEVSVPLIVSSSEVLGPWCRRQAAEVFHARILDYYGQAERVAFASSDDAGAYRFLPSYAHVELLPVDSAEGPTYEIVGTSRWNRAMPLVRYRTGDLIRSEAPLDAAAREEIALGVRTFAGVLGRDGDILVAPDGTRLTGIDHFHRGVDHIVRIQVVHETPERVVVRVLPADGFSDAERDQLLANVRRKLPGSMQVEVVRVDALERTAAGKTPFVIRRAAAARAEA